jgi:hypothetical protein
MPSSVDRPTTADLVCKGSFILGTACGKCARCRDMLAEGNRLGQRRTDAERLDWLDHVTATTNARHGTVYGWKYDINHNRAALTDMNRPALTIREAIDEAMDRRTRA